MNRVLVVGATGNVGREVVSQLLVTGLPIRALTRNPEAAQLPPEVEVVRGDLAVPETLDKGLDGIDAVFLVWTAPPATVVPALKRITKKARRIVFLSSPHKTPHPFFQQPKSAPSAALANRTGDRSLRSGVDFLATGDVCCKREVLVGDHRSALAMSCDGLISLFRLRPSTSAISHQWRSARCVRTDTRERSMF